MACRAEAREASEGPLRGCAARRAPAFLIRVRTLSLRTIGKARRGGPGPTRTDTSLSEQRILSPVRLPIPPRGRWADQILRTAVERKPSAARTCFAAHGAWRLPASGRAWSRDPAAFAGVEGPPDLRLIPAHPIPPRGRRADQILRTATQRKLAWNDQALIAASAGACFLHRSAVAHAPDSAG